MSRNTSFLMLVDFGETLGPWWFVVFSWTVGGCKLSWTVVVGGWTEGGCVGEGNIQ